RWLVGSDQTALGQALGTPLVSGGNEEWRRAVTVHGDEAQPIFDWDGLLFSDGAGCTMKTPAISRLGDLGLTGRRGFGGRGRPVASAVTGPGRSLFCYFACPAFAASSRLPARSAVCPWATSPVRRA